MRTLCVAIAAVVVASPVAAQNPDASAIVTRAARVYKGLSGLQADFRQRIEDQFLGNTDARGVLYQAGAGKFAMRFSDPPNEAIVIDGSKTWLYLPSTMPGQVARYPAPSNPVYGLNLLAWLLERPLERYRVSFVKTEDVDGRKADAVLLDAIAPDLPFRRATVWFSREDGLPRRLEINERTGGKRIVQLSRLQPNASIQPSVFVFNVPKGVKIVDQKVEGTD